MRKQVKQYLRRSLCGILSAAMILTGSSLSGFTVYAEETNMSDEVQAKEADDGMDVATSGENSEAVQESDVEDNTDGNEDGTGVDDADKSDSSGQEQTGDEETLPGDNGFAEEASGNDDGTDGSTQTDDVMNGETEDDAVSLFNDEIAPRAADGVYENVTVNFNYYVGELGADETVGFYKWNDDGGSITLDTTANPLLSWGGWGNKDKNPVYEMQSVEGYAGWYNITFTVTDTLTDAASLAGFSVFISSNTASQVLECSGYSNAYPEIYAGLLSGDITAVKEGKGYATIEDAEVSTEALSELVAEAKKLSEEDYKALGWQAFSAALVIADEVLAKEAPTSSEVQEAYENLEKAMNALVPITAVEAEINVKPVALSDDFITGADISSYWSLKQSGTVFKDENGNELSDAEFFKYLYDGGTNWIRIRVWNDPYDSDRNGYGGGNNDLEKAKIMGKLATDAGMRILIDFHYSDFWADPGKQQAPKAWASMSVDEKAEAVYQFTKDSLNELKSAGVDVGMVQVGNETTNGICGVFYSSDGWAEAAKIYNAGSKAVREFDENCLVAIHFTNPERSGNYANFAKNLDAQKVDYDVFASSYYPFWHGTTENLTSVLANVAKTYGKKVMVAETSWATTLDDQDGHDNTVRKGANDTNQPYAFSLQGQADEIRAVVEAANNINNVEGAAGSSIGVFYWEAAWLSPYYVYEEDGSKNEELLNKNKAAWEQYGSGWAASYGGDYDPEDAGKWYGGSAVDNQAWFGFDGAALPTAKIYSYIRTGAETEKAVSDVENPSVTIKAGETFDYPEKVIVIFNDGTSAECPVEWNQEDQAELDTNEPGDHTVRGIATCEYMISDGSIKTATRSVTLTITVEMTLVAGLINPGFEDADMSAWTITGSGTARKNEDPRTGTYGVHFYNTNAVTSTVMQKIENLDAGTYIFGGYIQGDALGTTAEAVVNVYDSAGTLKDTKTAECTTAGWCVWQNPEVVGVVVSEGDYLEVGMKVNAVAAGWGTIDDFYLYKAYAYDILQGGQITNGTLSFSADKSVSGETITVTVTPDTGYALYQLMVTGRGVTADTLTSEHGTVTYDEKTKTAVLTYSDKIAEATTESFIMPNSKVTVSAVFRTDVDLSALESLIEEYGKVTNDNYDYTEESWNTFTNALEAARVMVENLEATQDEIDSIREALETAYNGLEKAPVATPEEIAALQTLIEEYEKVTNDGYTEESWKTFTDALAEAKAAVEKENVTTTEIAGAKQALETAHNRLEKSSVATPEEIAALQTLIEEYEKVTNDGYTEESWKTFTDALAEAKAAVEKENVTTAEIAGAKRALEIAYNGLEKSSAATPEEIVALQTLIEEYEKVTNDGYTEESWKTFTDALAEAKAAAEKENVTTAEIAGAKQALETAYQGLKKESIGETADLTGLNALIAEYGKVTSDGYTEESWKIFADALEAAKETAAKEDVTQAEADSAKAVLEAAYAGLKEHHEGLWIAPIDDQTYTGSAIKPEIEVRYNDELLEVKKDYTVAYKNNTNAGTATVTVKGKGNFKDSDTATFTINKKDISDEDITVADVYAIMKANGTVTNPKPVVKFGKKTLKANNDYKLIWPDDSEMKDEDGRIKAGEYEVTISTTAVKKQSGNDVDSANYTGSRTIRYTVCGSDTKLMSKAVIRLEKTAVDYAGVNGADTEKPAVISVKIGSTTLTEGVDYEVSDESYENWNQVGKATVTVTAKEGTVYYGSKSVTYTVNGTKLAAKDLTIEGIDTAYEYTGAPIYVSANGGEIGSLKVTRIKGVETPVELKEGTDYEVSYKTGKKAGEHTNVGTVTVTITGINAYTGSVNKTFKITPVDLATFQGENVPAGCAFAADSEAKFTKTGAKPEITELSFNGTALVEKQDYTVSYSKNTKVDPGKTSATMTIKGKGNFTGQIRHEYEVTLASADDVYATAVDIVKPVRFNQVKSTVKVYEKETGKALKAGTDYDKTITYYSDKECTTPITEENFAEAANIDHVIYAKVTMKGNYAGTVEIADNEIPDSEIPDSEVSDSGTPGSVIASFRVYDKDLKMTSKNLVVTVDTTVDKDGNPIACDTTRAKNPYYTGSAIEPKVTVTVKGSDPLVTLEEGTHYAVSYTNNINKGKGTITLTGIGNGYGGSKSVKFTIVSKDMKWYEKAAQGIADFFSELF